MVECLAAQICRLESHEKQSELDRGSEGMWLSLDAIWSLWVKTCHEQSVTSD